MEAEPMSGDGYDREVSRGDGSEKLTYRIAAWAFFILLGPLHFGGEMVGPTGHTDWRQWFCAISGSLIWAAVIMTVINSV